MTVISRTWAGLPPSFHPLRGVFSVSAYFMFSWVPRIVVLLFCPQWMDPAFSDVYCHRTVLVNSNQPGLSRSVLESFIRSGIHRFPRRLAF